MALIVCQTARGTCTQAVRLRQKRVAMSSFWNLAALALASAVVTLLQLLHSPPGVSSVAALAKAACSMDPWAKKARSLS